MYHPYNSFRPLCKEHLDEDFFHNIIHLQAGKRSKALSLFRQVMKDISFSEAKLDQRPAPEQIYVDVMVIALTILVLLARNVRTYKLMPAVCPCSWVFEVLPGSFTCDSCCHRVKDMRRTRP